MALIDQEGHALIKVAARRIREVVDLVPDDPMVYLEDGALQDRVTLRLVLAIQGCLSLAAELVSRLNLPTSGGLGGLFATLVDEGILPVESVGALQAASGLRNRILFDFDSVNVNEVYDAALELPEVLVDFLAAIAEADEEEESLGADGADAA